MQTRAKFGIFKHKHILSWSTFVSEVEPISYSQASNFSHWRDAIAEEYNALISNHTWDFVHAQPCLNIVGSEWVYKVRYCSDDNVERYKARLITQGFH